MTQIHVAINYTLWIQRVQPLVENRRSTQNPAYLNQTSSCTVAIDQSIPD